MTKNNMGNYPKRIPVTASNLLDPKFHEDVQKELSKYYNRGHSMSYSEDNSGKWNNEGRKEVKEDFSDSPFIL